MAKKIKATKGTKGMEVNPVTGEDAIKRYAGKTLQQLGVAAADLGTSGNAKGIQASLCGIAFAVGRVARAKKSTTHNFADNYNVFAEPYYRGRKAPDAATMKTYLNNYGAFAEAGMREWDAEPVAVAALNVLGSAANPIALSWRAAKVRKLLESETAPAKEDIAKVLVKKAGKKRTTSERNYPAMINGMLAQIEKVADDDFVKAMAAKLAPSKVNLLRAIFDSAWLLRKEMIPAMSDDAKAKATKAANALQAAIKRMPARTDVKLTS